MRVRARQAGNAVRRRQGSGRRRAESARVFCFHCSTKWRGSGVGASVATRLDARAFEAAASRPPSGLRPGGSAWSSGRDIPACLARNSRAPSGSAGSATSAKCASAGVWASGAPVWKPSQLATAAEPRSDAVEPDRRVLVAERQRDGARPSATAAPAAAARAATGATVPGRAMASMTARNTVCALKTGSPNPPSMCSAQHHQSSPRTMVKKSTLVAAVSARRCWRRPWSASCASGSTIILLDRRPCRVTATARRGWRRAAPFPCRGRAR